MKWFVYAVGNKKRDKYSSQCELYLSRISRNVPVQARMFPDDISMYKSIRDSQDLILLDETGQLPENSKDFSNTINKILCNSSRDTVFAIGGAYGHIKEMRERAIRSISLSPLTMPHQMARLFLLEQLYRALSILNNEPYSH
ncbi:MAG: 23S rRNA (pseudouridine(1915)-N(3))-methyltransferase RlmH [Deltaproteobacteria bacterium]|nr:23S rRNA (pseudouridine(1915)-N(3))-methyltransferase RlmH [Deltaproteobacteria bacterium]